MVDDRDIARWPDVGLGIGPDVGQDMVSAIPTDVDMQVQHCVECVAQGDLDMDHERRINRDLVAG